MKNKRLKISLVILGAVVLGIVALYLVLMLWMKADLGEVYPDSITSTTMHVIKRRILHYGKQNNRLPSSVEELPDLKGFYSSNTDYWGGKIMIRVDGTKVSLISYGKDMKPGGKGANLDLIAVFDAKASTGAWADENDDGHNSWIEHPILRWNKADYQ